MKIINFGIKNSKTKKSEFGNFSESLSLSHNSWDSLSYLGCLTGFIGEQLTSWPFLKFWLFLERAKLGLEPSKNTPIA